MSAVFSTGATGAIAPVILRKRLIAPAAESENRESGTAGRTGTAVFRFG